ncbi:hypothetical protein D6783_05135 [Candidatus Woesearchaeota archaeon]|nr:MAG: hypothetical protein D6783_05135 [Candidatus Woesearchaeota archaeon]
MKATPPRAVGFSFRPGERKYLWFLKQGMKKVDSKQRGAFAVVAAIIVLFSAMWNPMVSVVVSFVALVSYGIYMFVQE